MCINPPQTGFVGEGSDHLQLIKFWPSCALGKGICGGVKIFDSTLLQTTCSVCVSLTAFSFVSVLSCQCRCAVKVMRTSNNATVVISADRSSVKVVSSTATNRRQVHDNKNKLA